MPTSSPPSNLLPTCCFAAAADSLPSCCFFTFFNTHQSLNCVAFSSDAAAVAGERDAPARRPTVHLLSRLSRLCLCWVLLTAQAPECALFNRAAPQTLLAGHAAGGPDPSHPAATPAGGFADSSVRLYDLQARASGAAAGAAPADWVTYFAGHSGPVFGLDFSPDNQLLFSASGDGSVRCALMFGCCLWWRGGDSVCVMVVGGGVVVWWVRGVDSPSCTGGAR